MTACSNKQECTPIETKVYIDKPTPYPVYAPCKTEEVKCGELRGTPIEKQDQSLKCIMELRKSIEGCK
ncbi:MAG: hypothetical protein RQ763_00135 [Sulfurimonas sp.]|uniref:hypothetical protein n=1 Tax=Sulfurimonas sp. TaxID=2022749 RepID=UPI0028CCC1B0|nr:hypothetical protein [Sulfurimonas sp.]MDT8337581.1 hypothetical protein [Sulfurimonas sp.]